MQTRTKRQKEVLEFITRYIERHGYEPSYQQIARHLGVASKAGIAKHISALEAQGLLNRKRENGVFNLELRSSAVVNDAVCRIEWLDTPAPDATRENYENDAVFVPKFMLGYYEPDNLRVFRVPSDAMSDKHIIEDDIALIEKKNFARDGDLIVALIEEKRAVLKNHYRDGAFIELRPANDKYQPVKLPADKIKILGVFRGLLRISG